MRQPYRLCLCLLVAGFGLNTNVCVEALPQQQDIARLKTVAEASDFLATCTYTEVVDFLDQCCAADHVTRYDFGKSVEGRAMIATIVARPPYRLGRHPGRGSVQAVTADEGEDGESMTADNRLRILLLGNIHSGECAGKEALLAMLRELASDPDHPWLSDCVFVMVPNYNVDANERIGPGQRRGQVGPQKGMGQRENAMQLDLNRDFCKLETPEARALVHLMDTFDPHLFIDCHTTNGSRHQYVLTYDIPHNPTAPSEIRDYLRNNMMPAVTRKLEQEGVLTFFYGNFSRDNSQWITYGHEPRYSTEYAGLRGCLGVLAEAYSYATYQQRIEGTAAFLRQCIVHVRENSGAVRRLLDSVHNRHRPGDLVHIDSRMTALHGQYKIRGFDGDEKKDYEVTFLGAFQPVTTVTMPHAYALPPEMSLLAERLQMHGITVSKLELEDGTPAGVTGRAYTVTAINRSPRPFQKHNMVKLEVAGTTSPVTVHPDSFIVSTRQPLGRLVSYLLEPETNEGFVTWNFLDHWLAEGQPYPIYRIENELVSINPVNEIKPSGRLRLSDIFGPDKVLLGELSLDDVRWLPDGKSYTLEKNGRRVAVDAASGAESRLSLPFDLTDLARAMQEVDGRQRSDIRSLAEQVFPLKGDDQRLFTVVEDGHTWVFDATAKRALRLGTEAAPAELADLNPAGNQVAFVQDHNLWLLTDVGSDPLPVTTDGSDKVLNGKLDWVYQEELYGRGNFKAFWWSPDGKLIAWLRTDESPVFSYTVTDHVPVRGELQVTAYPKAGDPLPQVRLGIYDVAAGSTTWASLPQQPEEPLQELRVSRVTWEPQGHSLLVQVQDRIQSWLDLGRVQAASGDWRVLFRDQTPAWIRSPGDPLFLEDGSFLWTSPRSGYNAIYRYSRDGVELARLTNDAWEVRELLACDEQRGLVYFTGSPDGPTEVVPMRASLDGTEVRRLVDRPGCFSVRFHPRHSWFLAEHSTADQQEEILLYDADGRMLRNVIPNRDDWLRHLAIRPPEFLQIPVGEEDVQASLDAMLIRPADFRADRRYPVVVHIYGGPQAPRVRNRFGGQSYLWHQYLAQQGFVVFVVDNRSSSYRSADQVWPIYRDLARRELADIEWAVNWLIEQNSWVDAERIGIWGWSYGGYMTSYALTHSRRFRCGIAGAPVTDWKNYDAIYTERYMDTPQANPQGYTDSSVVQAADRLHGELLLVHGTIDDNVHISNTLQLARALQKAGKQFRMMVYPENRHAVRNPDQRSHLFRLMTDFLTEHLQPGHSD
jgi:dipeptidyl aminopeptidase/acylaminoacyl peptidase